MRKWTLYGLGIWSVLMIGMMVLANMGKGDAIWGGLLAKIPYGDKVGHLCLLSVLSWLGNMSWRRRLCWGVNWVSVVILVIFSIEEWQQVNWVNRTRDWNDWYANGLGIVLGQWLAMVGIWWMSRRQSSESEGKSHLRESEKSSKVKGV